MRKTQNFNWPALSLGTCYYPEHWDKKLWREDLRRMKENGIFTVQDDGVCMEQAGAERRGIYL